ncbi:hypothetical protein ACI5KX_08900 [Erythrobacter sp. GH1-10]|uniref:hypothetical protein n=1 Tax=Erythrobacter sp. GH1-10 TaxID=3349334 RepID=UPI003877A632
MPRTTPLIIAAMLALVACSGEREDKSEALERGGPTARNLPEVAPQPVRIGFDGPRFDACAGYGLVTNLNPNGDNYLSVRAAPNGNAEEIDRLGPGKGVSMCQQVGNWIGVVYGEGEEGIERCGTGAPVPSVRAYEGPCKSGWVNENFIELIAG